MSDVSSIYIYNGVDHVPNDVAIVRVDSSVTVIPEGAFREHLKLEEVELSEGLITIGINAFYGCASLKRINLPSSIEEIEISAFECCYKLDDIILPDGLQRLGVCAFFDCYSLQRINIPPDIEVINEGAFCNCWGLTDIRFSEGLREIGEDAFSRCKSLASVNLPSSLKDIGDESFEGCKVLNEIHIPDTIESIQGRAFKNCSFTNFRIAPSMGNIVDISIVGGNISLVSLELPETIEQLDDNYSEQFTDLSVRNIALPSNFIDTDILHNCTDLGTVLPGSNNSTIREALQHIFDELPIHKICYYQSYHDNETTMQSLKREINPWTTKPPGQLNTTGKQQDCLGMTPLHILASSTKPTIEMYRLLIDKYPETLIMKDKWGDVPLLYALWCSAPSDVLAMLVASYKSLHPNYEFDWKGMILTMAKANVSHDNIHKLVMLSDQKYDMQGIVLVLAKYDTSQASFNKPCTAVDTIHYLLLFSVTDRLDSLGIAKWRIDLENRISSLPKIAKNRDRDIQEVYDRLATYESIKESTPLLELALWKAKIDECRNKRARTDGGVNYRDQCRINCGADVIIRNVLPYLLPNEMRIDSSDSNDDC